MSNKKAFVFDTNFIIEHSKDLKEVVGNLESEFNVYVTQVAIDERKSQQYLEMKKKYDAIQKLQNDYKGIANIEITTEITKRHQILRDEIQNNYVKLLGGRVIPFSSSKKLLDIILDRVYKKVPPFSTEEKASDKGFKDTLMWCSILEYFKENGEQDVVFVTNDGLFTRNVLALRNEFSEFTGKKIEIHDNTYYSDLIKTDEQPAREQTLHHLPDVGALRDKIQNIISDICGSAEYDNWGNFTEFNAYFTLSAKINANDTEPLFLNLKNIIENNIFEPGIWADDVFQFGNIIINKNRIPTNALQEALKLYEEIRNNMGNCLTQFFSTASNIINRNYKEPEPSDFTDDIPF